MKFKKVIISVIPAALLASAVFFGYNAFKEHDKLEQAENTYDNIRSMVHTDDNNTFPEEEPAPVGLDDLVQQVAAATGGSNNINPDYPDNTGAEVTPCEDPDEEKLAEINDAAKDEEPFEIDHIDDDWVFNVELNIPYLQYFNSDIQGWIYVPGVGVDYPVVKEPTYGEDIYLGHDAFRNDCSSGALYVKADVPDANEDAHMVIYGHNMQNGTMFSLLKYYKSRDFYKSHPYFYLFYPDRTERYRIAAVNRLYYWSSVYARPYRLGSQLYSDMIQGVMDTRYYDTGVEIDGDDNTVMLSTCDWYYSDHAARLVLTGVKDKVVFKDGNVTVIDLDKNKKKADDSEQDADDSNNSEIDDQNSDSDSSYEQNADSSSEIDQSLDGRETDTGEQETEMIDQNEQTVNDQNIDNNFQEINNGQEVDANG